jgi:hypothetical protein
MCHGSKAVDRALIVYYEPSHLSPHPSSLLKPEVLAAKRLQRLGMLPPRSMSSWGSGRMSATSSLRTHLTRD